MLRGACWCISAHQEIEGTGPIDSPRFNGFGKRVKKMAKKIFPERLLGFYLSLSLVSVALAFSAPCAKAQGTGSSDAGVILTIGSSTIVQGNLAAAKNSAISLALMKGVEYYLASKLGSQGMLNNFQRIVEEILPGAREEIENFNVLAEEQFQDQVKVLVRLRINEKVMEEKLKAAGIVLGEGPALKILFMVRENKNGTLSYWWKDAHTIRSPLSSAELIFNNIYQERGFKVLDRTVNVPEADYPRDLNAPELQDPDLLLWGKAFGADIVFHGQMDVVGQDEISLKVTVLDVNQASPIAQDVQVEQVGKGTTAREPLTAAMERAVNRSAAKLTPSIIRVSRTEHEKVERLELTLKGMTTYKQFTTLRDFLTREVPGVKSVKQTRVRKDSIAVAVEFQGSGDTFLDRLLHHGKLPFPLQLEQKDEAQIVLRME